MPAEPTYWPFSSLLPLYLGSLVILPEGVVLHRLLPPALCGQFLSELSDGRCLFHVCIIGFINKLLILFTQL